MTNPNRSSDRLVKKAAELHAANKYDLNTARWISLLAYLDEREEQLHPIARPMPVPHPCESCKEERHKLVVEVNRLNAELSELKRQQPYRDEEMRQQGRTERDGEVAELRSELEVAKSVRDTAQQMARRHGAVVEAVRKVAFQTRNGAGWETFGRLYHEHVAPRLAALDQPTQSEAAPADPHAACRAENEELRRNRDKWRSRCVGSQAELADARAKLSELTEAAVQALSWLPTNMPHPVRQRLVEALAGVRGETCEPPRPIVVGSKWRDSATASEFTVKKAARGKVTYLVPDDECWAFPEYTWPETVFRNSFVWVSDPPAEAVTSPAPEKHGYDR